MTEPGFDELMILNRKLDELLVSYNNIRSEYRELKKMVKILEGKLQAREERIKELEIKYERARLSGALVGEGENVFEAKRKITELVREIDRCVALLNR